jgi:glycosyltransferase involved in cell wall biosynthesis
VRDVERLKEPPAPSTGAELPPVDVLVATYNSGWTLRASLESARRHVPIHCLIVLDHGSRDGTLDIAREFGARIQNDAIGLGFARNECLRVADTDPVLFLDSDVRIVRPDFYPTARREYARPRTGAVVGESVGHRFHYGLPLGLTLIGRRVSLEASIPDRVLGRETYYLQRALRTTGRRVRYVSEAMVHEGTYRSAPHWPEFQGAWIRNTSRWNPRELVYAAEVVLLMHMNSRRPRNVLYSPIFYGKLMRGFLAPDRWAVLERNPDRLSR